MATTFQASQIVPGALPHQARRAPRTSRRAAVTAATGKELAKSDQKTADRQVSRDVWGLDGPSFFRRGSLFRTLEDEFKDLRSFWDDRTAPAALNLGFGAADVQELEKAFQISVDLPGITKENIKVQVNRERILTISGQRESSSSSEQPSGFHKKERSVGTFQRQFRLPASADTSAITAKAENGTLVVEVPKLESEVSSVTDIEIA